MSLTKKKLSAISLTRGGVLSKLRIEEREEQRKCALSFELSNTSQIVVVQENQLN
jgi:hypothetical protein